MHCSEFEPLVQRLVLVSSGCLIRGPYGGYVSRHGSNEVCKMCLNEAAAETRFRTRVKAIKRGKSAPWYVQPFNGEVCWGRVL